MSDYIPTIGLEIHAELKTKTKMFCSSKNHPDEERPNVNVCPVCMAHPGTLPVINREAVKHVLRVGIALKGTLADYTEFDRKNYFYPDLPKGYQLSQYEYPLVSSGELAGVELTRVHLEEDTASSMHDESGERGETTIDYNRAGVPLMELVTEPVITSAKQAGDFARELQLLLRTLGASEANMEKGEMRVEANVSVAKKGERGTKVEIKNLNSFKAMERAVDYEIARQTKVLEKGETVVQETRGWDDGKQSTFPQRIKEGSADYRYFPDPDLPSLKLSELSDCSLSRLSAEMPELPWNRRARYIALGVKEEDAAAYVESPRLGNLFESVIADWGGDKNRITLASNYIANDLVNLIRDTEGRDTETSDEISISARNFSKIIELLAEKKVSSRTAKDLLARTVATGEAPEAIAEHEGLFLSDTLDISSIIRAILEKHASVAADYRSGKAAALNYLLGLAMKEAKGAADPAQIRSLLEQELSKK